MPTTKKMAGHFLNQVFSYEGVHHALEMTGQATLNHEVMELDAATVSTVKTRSLGTPARGAVRFWKVLLEKPFPKEIHNIDNENRLA
jgi:hypothetical protein